VAATFRASVSSKREDTHTVVHSMHSEENKIMRSFRIISLLCFVLMAVTAIGFAGNRRFDKKFQVSPGGTLVVSTDLGDVRVTGTSSNEVSVLIEMEGNQKTCDEFDLSAEQNTTGVEVKGKNHHSGWNIFRSHNLDARFTISVPRSYSVRLETAGGDVEVRDIQGAAKGGTSGGNVIASNIEGTMSFETSGGDIRVESSKGMLHCETSGGDIHVKSITGDVDVETSGGNVTVAGVEGKVRAETSGGNVTVKVIGSNKGVHAETSGGNVDVFVAKNCAANIDASTSGGEVECNLPVTVEGKIRETSIKGTINGGGPLIYAHTSGGNVRIRPAE
jgi:DUF4097 and DUF4098 domain-containing protein YvlB